jgi:uridine kinase
MPSDAQPFLIGIGGPSGSGKSALAAALLEALGTASAVVVPVDAYYRDLSALPFEERCAQNFDAPEALDWGLLEGHVKALLAGESIDQPRYDFATHTRRTESHRVDPVRYVLVEGLLALHPPELRRLFGLSVYVAAPGGVCLARRIDRDAQERSRTRESVIQQYEETVAPMARAFVLPTRDLADLVVDGEGRLEESVAAVMAAVAARCR